MEETEGQMAERLASYSDPPEDFFDIYPGWYMRFDMGNGSSDTPACPTKYEDCTCGSYDDFGPYKTKAGLLSAFRAVKRHAEKVGCSSEIRNYVEPWFESEYIENI